MRESLRQDQAFARNFYTFDHEELDMIYNTKKEQHCPNCGTWQTKTRELIWGYEELAQAKEKELEALVNMINKLDDQMIKLQNKYQIMCKRLDSAQSQYDSLQKEHEECQKVVQYYKDREVDLLTQLKSTQNQLFTKSVLVKDEKENKEQKNIQELAEAPRNRESRTLTKMKTEPNLMPILKSSQSLGKLLQKSLTDIEQMGRQKLLLELKHRMAVLKAVELSVLK